MTAKTLIKKAKKYADCMDWKEFDNGVKRVIITSEVNTPEWNYLIELLRKVDEGTSLSMDSRYRFTMEALGMIADSVAEKVGEFDDLASEIEADVYTSDLTEWLSESNNHVYYLTEVMQEYQPEDGFALLTMAQARAMEEAFFIVLEYLKNN